ncbi:secretion/conjugation apparatus DotM-related subunit [Piscirickettsia litoralis]
MFGILSAFVCYKRSEAEAAANEISSSFQKNNLNYTLALSLFENFKDKGNIKKIVSSHNYVYTVFSSLLEQARQSGTVSTASFFMA